MAVKAVLGNQRALFGEHDYKYQDLMISVLSSHKLFCGTAKCGWHILRFEGKMLSRIQGQICKDLGAIGDAGPAGVSKALSPDLTAEPAYRSLNVAL